MNVHHRARAFERPTLRNRRSFGVGTLLLLLACSAFAVAVGASAAAAKDGEWKPLFDGRSIEGWVRRGGTATYRVDGDAIAGKTAEGSPNTFLCPPGEYENFELEFEVKVDDELNSGVQIRSRSIPEWKNGQVHGPQVEIATNGSAGFVYGEGLDTGWLLPPVDEPKIREAFRKGEWNRYRIVARGPHIRTWINGTSIADFQELTTGMKSGFIGLQVHGIARGAGPYEVRWRRLRIRTLE